MPSVPGPDDPDAPDRTVYRAVLAALAFEKVKSLSRYVVRRSPKGDGKRRRQRRRNSEDRTIEETDDFSEDDSYFDQQIDIYYDARERNLASDEEDEDSIPIGLETEEERSMRESVEATLRQYPSDSSGASTQYFDIPIENLNTESCSTMTVSEAPTKSTSTSSPEDDLPLRFLRACKGDVAEGLERYKATLAWRKENNVDNLLKIPHPNFSFIKKNLLQYIHLKGRNGDPVFYEKPPKTDLKALKQAGIGEEMILSHYAMIVEYLWQYVEKDDLRRSIYVIDLDGMRMSDFVGETVEFVRKATEFTSQHYPERAGVVFVVNVPSWFKFVWNVVKTMVDEATLEKIFILRGRNEIFEKLSVHVAPENIPPEYGGTSMPLGESPEEKELNLLMEHNIAICEGVSTCAGEFGNPPCKFCSFYIAHNH